MPLPSAYRRAPMMNPAYVALPDPYVTSGLEKLAQRLLRMVDPQRSTPLQKLLATHLGGWEGAPAMPDLEGLDPRDGLRKFTDTLTAAEGIAFLSRDEEGVRAVGRGVMALSQALPDLGEAEIFSCGADLLRVLADLYRRTGMRAIPQLAEQIRSRLPDVSSFCHSFPFDTPFTPSDDLQNREYHERMARFADGRQTADTLAICALLCQFTGSGKEMEAAGTGLASLMRFHGLPGGAFSADPYLAGRDQTGSADVLAVCALAEACADALLLTGENDFAEKLEQLLANVFPCLIPEKGGIREYYVPSCLEEEPVVEPTPEEVTALLKALCAIRRVQFSQPEDHSVALLLPLSGAAVLRIGQEPVRITVTARGFYRREVKIRVECRSSVFMGLRIRVPGYADGARLLLNGEDPRMTPAGQYAVIERTFSNNDELTLQMMLTPRAEHGWRGAISYYCGETLLALPLPGEGMEWRYALLPGAPAEGGTMDGKPCARVSACPAPDWTVKNGLIAPPPQNLTQCDPVTLTLLPAVAFPCRVAALPVCRG